MKNVSESLVLEFFERVWHKPHNLDAIDELMTEDYVIVTAGQEIKGRNNFKSWVKKFQDQLLHAKTESLDIFSNKFENMVVSRWVCSGTNNGIMNFPADNQFLSFTGIAIWELRGNKLARCWVERSAFELYQQLDSGSKANQFI